MNRLDSILIGIEKLRISATKKNMYMLEILLETNGRKKIFHKASTGSSREDLRVTFTWQDTFRGGMFYARLFLSFGPDIPIHETK